MKYKPFTSKHCTPINYGSPLKKEDDKKPKQTYKGGEFDPKVKVKGEVVVTAKKPEASGQIVTKGGVKYRKIGGNLYPVK